MRDEFIRASDRITVVNAVVPNDVTSVLAADALRNLFLAIGGYNLKGPECDHLIKAINALVASVLDWAKENQGEREMWCWALEPLVDIIKIPLDEEETPG